MKNLRPILLAALASALALCLSSCRVGPREDYPADPENIPPDTLSTEAEITGAEPDAPDETYATEPVPVLPPETLQTAQNPGWNAEEETGTEPVEADEDTVPAEDDAESEPVIADYDEIEPIDMWAEISLNVRYGPSTDYESRGTIAEGQKVTAIGEADGWYVIEFRSQPGFVSGRYLSENPPEEENSEDETAEEETPEEETVEEESSEDGTAEDGIGEGEIAEDGTAEDETAGGEASAPDGTENPE